MGLYIAINGPNIPYVTIILSIPVCGVEIKKEVAEALLAPCFLKYAVTGITPHEHRGIGTPNKEAKNIDLKFCLPKYFEIFSTVKTTDKNPAIKKPIIRYGES
tara:strand:+ start:337 stop:645 length:309 start_codon:yes stop_codon:yes gene_type:complete